MEQLPLSSIQMLLEKGVPQPIVDRWESCGFTKLLPVQAEAVERGVLNGQSLMVVAPTSSGKTFVGELAATANASIGQRVIYLVPFKSIAEEKYRDFREVYATDGIDLKICICDGDHREHDNDVRVGQYDIAIVTYEKFTSLLVSNAGILDTTDCVIVDEIQMVMDPERGGGLELLLTKLKAAQHSPQIIGLSAVLGELNQFDSWLGIDVIRRDERPVELREGVVSPTGQFDYKEANSGSIGVESFGGSTIKSVIRDLLKANEQVIVILNSRRRAESIAEELANTFSQNRAAPQTIATLNDESETETRDLLLRCLRHGIAFHNADCELSERHAVESGFRSGEIRILCATTTLSMGVNLPCKTVVLADTKKWRSVRGQMQLVSWDVAEVKNILGRAGRLGLEDAFGRGMILANDTAGGRMAQNRFVNGNLPSFKSVFDHTHIARWVLDVVATGFAGTARQIFEFIATTYGARTWSNDIIKEQMQRYVEDALESGLKNDLYARSPSGLISATNLGKACASQGCSIDSFIELKNSLAEMEHINAINLAYAAAGVVEVNDRFYRGLSADATFRARLQNRVSELSADDEWIDPPGFDVASASDGKRNGVALLCRDIVDTSHRMRDLRKAYSVTVAAMRHVCGDVSWMCDTLAAIADCNRPSDAENIRLISECIRHRVPMSCRFLNHLDVPLSRDEKLRLVDAGIDDEDKLVESTQEDLRGVINPRKGERLIAQINRKRERNQSFWQRDHRRRLAKLSRDTQLVESLYNAEGIPLENAICDLFHAGFADCKVSRIADQNKGEPDLLVTFPDGAMLTVQVTAKESNTKFVDSKKAGDVIPQSARFHPDGFVCLGRPDFQDLAREQADHQAKDHNFKLLPMYVLSELFVRHAESRIDSSLAAQFLRDVRGYLPVHAIDDFVRHQAELIVEA